MLFLAPLALPGAALLKKLLIGGAIVGGGSLATKGYLDLSSDSYQEGAIDKLTQAISQGKENKYLKPNAEGKLEFQPGNFFSQQLIREEDVADEAYERINKAALRNPNFKEYRDALGALDMTVDQVGNQTPADFLATRQNDIANALKAKELRGDIAGITFADGSNPIIPQGVNNDAAGLQQLRQIKSSAERRIAGEPGGAINQIEYSRERDRVGDLNTTRMLDYKVAQAHDAAELARYQVDLARHQSDQRNRYNNDLLQWKSGEADADRKQQLGLYQLQSQNARAEREARETAAERRERMQMMLALISQGSRSLQQIRF